LGDRNGICRAGSHKKIQQNVVVREPNPGRIHASPAAKKPGEGSKGA